MAAAAAVAAVGHRETVRQRSDRYYSRANCLSTCKHHAVDYSLTLLYYLRYYLIGHKTVRHPVAPIHLRIGTVDGKVTVFIFGYSNSFNIGDVKAGRVFGLRLRCSLRLS